MSKPTAEQLRRMHFLAGIYLTISAYKQEPGNKKILEQMIDRYIADATREGITIDKLRGMESVTTLLDQARDCGFGYAFAKLKKFGFESSRPKPKEKKSAPVTKEQKEFDTEMVEAIANKDKTGFDAAIAKMRERNISPDTHLMDSEATFLSFAESNKFDYGLEKLNQLKKEQQVQILGYDGAWPVRNSSPSAVAAKVRSAKPADHKSSGSQTIS